MFQRIPHNIDRNASQWKLLYFIYLRTPLTFSMLHSLGITWPVGKSRAPAPANDKESSLSSDCNSTILFKHSLVEIHTALFPRMLLFRCILQAYLHWMVMQSLHFCSHYYLNELRSSNQHQIKQSIKSVERWETCRLEDLAHRTYKRHRTKFQV